MSSLRERAYALAAARALGARAEARCQKISPHAARMAAELAAALEKSPSLIARTLAEIDAPESAHAGVHPTWYETPPESARADAQRYLERLAFGHLLPAPRADERARGTIAATAELSPEALALRLRALGRRRVAIVFQAAPRTQLAHLCARLGEPAATELIAELAGLGTLSVDEVRAAQRSLLRLPSARLRTGDELFLETGCSWLGPALHHENADALTRLALRLPRELGRRLLEAALAPTTEPERTAALRLLAAIGV